MMSRGLSGESERNIQKDREGGREWEKERKQEAEGGRKMI